MLPRIKVAFLASIAFAAMTIAPLRADESRRLFDFTPVTADNPIVATINETIEIPLSELRAYRDAERLNTITDPASLAQKRSVLEDLITEYLYVDEAYQNGVDRSSGFVKQMAATRTMILTDFIADRVEKEKASTNPQPGDATLALADQLFEATDIRISNEAYAILKKAARAIDQARATPLLGPIVQDPKDSSAQLYAIINRVPEASLAQYEDRSISIRQLLAIYAGLPGNRPNLDTIDGLLAMLKPLIIPELMAIEAAKKGLADDPAFKKKLIQNQNALLRFHSQDLVDRRVNAAMSEPSHEVKMRAWHAANSANYAPPREKPDQSVPTYEQVRSRVEGDYSVALREQFLAEKARALRETHRIEINEAVLQTL